MVTARLWCLCFFFEFSFILCTYLSVYISLLICRACAQPLLRQLHWLPVQQRIQYKVAVLTFQCRHSTTAPTYLSRHIRARSTTRTLRSSAAPLLDKPLTKTTFASRAFRCSAPTVWNSLPTSVVDNNSLPLFKSRLKTYLYRNTFE